jgi:membrane associated rhomboid family serine protease
VTAKKVAPTSTFSIPGIHFNSPAILGFSIAAIAVHLLSFDNALAVPGRGSFHLDLVADYFRLISHVLGHGSWEHLFGNLTLLLLLGPILEDRYGTMELSLMMLATAIITGVANVLLSPYHLLGASGIVFMFITLASFVNIRNGTIPLTFILIAIIFIGKEIHSALSVKDNISQLAHIVGGIVGAWIGFRGKQ